MQRRLEALLAICLLTGPLQDNVIHAADPVVIRPDAKQHVRLPATAARLSGPSVRMNKKTSVAAWWKAGGFNSETRC